MKLFTTCVNYADFLQHTLPAWVKLGEVFVITRPDDRETQQLCVEFGASCEPTDAWFRGSAHGINKGAAQNDVIPPLAHPFEQIVLFDADVYPVGLSLPIIDPQDNGSLLLGCRRYVCHSREEFQRCTFDPKLQLALPEDTVNSYRPELVRGYFQTFRYREGMTFGRKRDKTFGGCDLWVAVQYPTNHWVQSEFFRVLHLGETAKNWKGRVTARW